MTHPALPITGPSVSGEEQVCGLSPAFSKEPWPLTRFLAALFDKYPSFLRWKPRAKPLSINWGSYTADTNPFTLLMNANKTHSVG